MTGAKQPDLSGMNYLALLAAQQEAQAEVANTKAWAIRIQSEIDVRLRDSAKAAFTQQQKVSGTLSMSLQDGIIAKVDIDKDVKWDSDKLLAVAQTLPWDCVRSLFKLAVSVPENTYKVLKDVDPALAAKVDEARTVKYSDPKIKLVREEV